jgi:kinase-associated protein B
VEFKNGEIVKFSYKTGMYVGIVIEKNESKTLVEVRAVLRHPKQGDLHSPMQVEVPLFHQRRALAYKEKVRIPNTILRMYDNEPPDYLESLRLAFNTTVQELSDSSNEWSNHSLANMKELEKDYFQK